MRILVAPDKFKGSLTAEQAAAAICAGFGRVFPDAHFDVTPIADGGEGTGSIFRAAMNGEVVTADAHDALGYPIKGVYSWFEKEKFAVVEMSEASGLWRLNASELNPLQASTFGTGELMAHAIARGAKTLFVALGGSATNDAGVGMAAALGWKFYDATDNEITPHAGNLAMIWRISPPAAPLPCKVKALCDVTNPLLGPNGATYVYGPQKGATPDMLTILEAGITRVADLCRDQLGRDFRDTPGAGATGGLAFGLLTFCDAQIDQGFDAISDLMGIREKILQADLVITAEGKIDSQSLNGKGPGEIARLAREMKKPVIAFAGMVEGSTPDIDACIPIADGPLTLEESRTNAAALLTSAAERTARVLKISLA